MNLFTTATIAGAQERNLSAMKGSVFTKIVPASTDKSGETL